VARTDARQVNGLDDAIQRCLRYKEAGANAVVVEAARTKKELALIAEKLPGPLAINMLEGDETPLLSKDELKYLGFQLLVYSVTALYTSTNALENILQVLQTRGTTRTALDSLIPFDHFNKILDLETYYSLSDRYRHSVEM